MTSSVKSGRPAPLLAKPVDLALAFFAMEAAGGIMLVLAAIVAMIVANSPLYEVYYYFLHHVEFGFGFYGDDGKVHLEMQHSTLHWVNDGLMAIFFFLVGLEIKRELVTGKLSSLSRAALPFIAATGGVAAPALIFWFLNRGNPENIHGWAIPTATDIAFALGVISLLGSRAPVSLKVLLTAIAIIDDLIAILVIALFYSGGILVAPLYVVAAALCALFLLNRRNVSAPSPYILLGFILWVAVLNSGIHATMAGVLTAFFIPVHSRKQPEYSPLETLEHRLHPWVAYGILPLFAFANAGVSLGNLGLGDIVNPVTVGIAAGLFIGKQLGIFSAILLAVKTGLSPKPEGANWVQIYAMAVLCGIGFTMSLFIGGLSYEAQEMQVYVRVGVLAASILSAVAGYFLLHFASKIRGRVSPAEQSTPSSGSLS